MKTKIKSIIAAAIILSVAVFSFNSCEEEGESTNENEEVINSYNNITIGNQFNTVGMYINLSTGKVYTPQEAFQNQRDIHLAFFFLSHYSGTLSVLCSPSEVPSFSNWKPNEGVGADFYHNPTYGFNIWTKYNITKFGATNRITEGMFNNIKTPSEMEKLVDPQTMILINVRLDAVVNDVYAFVTPEGKKGVMVVKNATGTRYKSGELVVNIKVIGKKNKPQIVN